MKKLVTLFRLTVALLVLEKVPAQDVAGMTSYTEWVVRSWKTGDGLPHNTVNALLQTRDGFLWVGTNGGLARFDGVAFQTFGLRDGLRSIWISSLAEDSEGGVWIGTFGGGLTRWKGGRFSGFGVEEGFPPGADVLSLAVDRDGSLWIGTAKGLLHLRDGKFEVVGDAQGLPQNQVRAVIKDSHGTLWVSVIPDGLFEGRNGRFVRTGGPQTGNIYSLMEDREGSVFAGCNQFLWKYQAGRWTKMDKASGLPVADLMNLAATRGGMILAGARNAGLLFSSGTRFDRPFKEGPFFDQFVSALTVDSQGLIWAGVAGGGLHRISPRILHFQDENAGLPRNGISSVTEEPAGTLWAASSKGIFRTQDGKFSKVSDPGVSGSPHTYCITANTDGSVWSAGEEYVYRFQPGEPVTAFKGPALKAEAIRAMWAVGKTMWLGTYSSALLKCEADTVRVMAPPGTFPGGITSLVRDAAEDTFWVGTSDGLHRWQDGKVKTWNTDDGLLTASIQSLHREKDGTLWVGTNGGGLARMKDGRFSNITGRHGLINETIAQMVADDFDHLWLGTIRGLMCVDLQELNAVADGKSAELHAVVFGKDEGMPVEQCSMGHSPTAFKGKNGHLYFPTAGGLAVIDPGRIREVTAVIPQPRIQDVRVDHQPQALDSPPLVIPPGTHRLEVNYTAPVLRGGERVRFRHRLEGLEKEWVPAGQSRLATYDGLPPGHYVFHLSAADGEENWNGPAATFPFTVQAFFWQTLWFRAGGSILLVGLSGAGAWWYLHRKHLRQLAEIEKERRQQAELAHLSRISSLGELSASLAHELSQPLGIILSNAQAAQRMMELDTPDIAEVREILSDIVEEDRRAGEVIKRLRALLARGETTLVQISLNEVIKDVLRLLRSDLIGRGVTVETELMEGAAFVLGDQVELQQVLLNLIINACDAMAGNSPGDRIIRLSTELQHGAVRLSLRDQGCGLPDVDHTRIFQPFFTTKNHGMGIGLSICRSIMTAHRGRLWAEPNPGRGTTFHMQLKIIPSPAL